MKFFLKTALAAAAVLGLAAPASATTFSCMASSISGSGVSDTGFVLAVTNFGNFYFCNVASTYGGVSADTCRAWLSQFLTAKGMNKPIRFHFDPAHPNNIGVTDCSPSNFQYNARVPFLIDVFY